MPGGVTLIVEPNPGGHRFDVVADVAGFAAQSSEVVLLTSSGASERAEFQVRLAALPVRVEEVYSQPIPTTRELADRVATYCRSHAVTDVVVLDGDTPLREWWLVAGRAFRGLATRPRVVFFLTRYPARLELRDLARWRLRAAKGVLILLAMATRSLHRVAGYAGRDERNGGWLVKRVRDTAVCSAHSRDRAALRAGLGLPVDRGLVGIFGSISPRKNPALVLEAITALELPADLLLAGPVAEYVRDWLDALPEAERARIIVADGFLDNDVLDRYLASADVVALAMILEGPSGIMGKALAAGVPVVSAGSKTRARELAATQGGLATDFTAAALAAAFGRVLGPGGLPAPDRNAVAPVTSDTFAATILGAPSPGSVSPTRGRTAFRIRARRGRRRP